MSGAFFYQNISIAVEKLEENKLEITTTKK